MKERPGGNSGTVAVDNVPETRSTCCTEAENSEKRLNFRCKEILTSGKTVDVKKV